jgi:hypothetical protein
MVLNMNVICRAAEFSRTAEGAYIGREARIDTESFELRSDAENVLADSNKGPGCSAGKPAVLAFAVRGGISACYHLAVCVRFGAVDIADVLKEYRVGFTVYIECAASVPEHSLRYNYPWIAVTEYASVFFVSGRI